ncbi:beta-galactosidase [Anaerocolumna sp. MB42-C2]|uniref:beta-galactosidase n=1 Tax=Anaerocolumna sp. MB42-C2 TaxID=3070997 RepID=UPI0027E0A608|nr:beta-galactosidase [Anaerocolumna sp. MB42-C2]WMJ85508.1 beta-galactosidase [Anaerocolumna sp. MB42-C2]
MEYFEEITLGICYYPEHWDESIWREDLKRMWDGGIRMIRIAEFAWNKFEIKEGVFDFSFFDHYLDVVEETDMKVIFCTPTATPPAWLTEKYPEVLAVDLDGRQYKHGVRRHYNYNAPIWKEKTRIIVTEMAKHYGHRSCIIGWQIDNELNCVVDEFYAEADHIAFREFLKNKYGNLDALNDAWGTVFWNQTYMDWTEVYLPRYGQRGTCNPHLQLDSIRFFSASCLEYCKLHSDILRKYIGKDVFITTNGMFNHADYKKMTKESLDFLSYDCYPAFGTMNGADELHDRKWSMYLAKVRAVSKKYGIMEQQSGPGGWYNFRIAPSPKPGQMRLWALQSIANGADFVSFFRWRTCTFGTEIYWHGILDYDNRDTRRLKELKDIAEDVKKIKDLAGREYEAKVAILIDYDNEWDGEHDVWHGPIRRYSNMQLFKALQEEHIPFNYLNMDADTSTEELQQYDLIFAPHMSIVTSSVVDKIKQYVERGGHFISGARTGYKDKYGRCPMETMPISMQDLFGVEVKDFTSVNESGPQEYAFFGKDKIEMPLFNDILLPISDRCKVLATYVGDYYDGSPAITENSYGCGSAIYFGAAFEANATKVLLHNFIEEWQENKEAILLIHSLASIPKTCETSLCNKDGQKYLFILNYEKEPATIKFNIEAEDVLIGEKICGNFELEPYGVMVLRI